MNKLCHERKTFIDKLEHNECFVKEKPVLFLTGNTKKEDIQFLRLLFASISRLCLLDIKRCQLLLLVENTKCSSYVVPLIVFTKNDLM